MEMPKDIKYLGVQISFVKYRIDISLDEEGAYVARAPALPGCIS